MTFFRTEIEDLGLLEAKRLLETLIMELKIGCERRHIVEVVNGVEGVIWSSLSIYGAHRHIPQACSSPTTT